MAHTEIKISQPFAQMSPEERLSYINEFSTYRMQEFPLVTDAKRNGLPFVGEVLAAFNHGFSLCSAFPLCVKTAKDVIRMRRPDRCVNLLTTAIAIAEREVGKFATSATAATAQVKSQRKPTDKKAVTHQSPQNHPANGDRSPQNHPVDGDQSPVATIPQGTRLHLDQVSFLLTPELAQRVTTLHDILNERDANANFAKQLAAEGKDEKAIAPYSKAACEAEDKANAIYAAVDEELALIVGVELYMRTNVAAGEKLINAFEQTRNSLNASAQRFGSLSNMLAALRPYYAKCNNNGRIDRAAEQFFADYAEPKTGEGAQSPAEAEHPEYDKAEYKRIWTYVSRTDVAHTDKRLAKMRQEIDTAIAAGMPNIEAMETIYQHECEQVAAEKAKALQEPSLL